MMDMQIAHYWAHVFGPFLVILGLWMLLYSDNLAKIVASMRATPACFHIVGVLQLLIGLILLTQCNVWMMSRVIFITLLGWFFVLRGVISLFFPQLLMKYNSKSKSLKYCGILPLVWGLLIYWFAMAV